MHVLKNIKEVEKHRKLLSFSINSINSIVTVRYSPLLTETNSVIFYKELNVFEHFSLQGQGGMQAHRLPW